MRIQREPRGVVERMDEQGTRAEGLVPVNDEKGMAASATLPVECAAGSDFAATIESTVCDVEARWGNTLRLLEDA